MKKHLPLILMLAACGTAPAELATTDSAAVDTVNIRRSLVVSNQAILDQRFAMRRVLDQLALQVKNDPTYGGAALFRDWWDTNNDAAHSQGGPLHCDSTLNGFPLQCPRQEGVLASVGLRDSGTDSWTPIALLNRFDLAPEDGANCGEYRIEYGKVGAFPIFDRTLVIFEAQMPNADPARGLAGCASIVDFWVKLSAVRNLSTRAGLLETFYFTGLPGNATLSHFAIWTRALTTGDEDEDYNAIQRSSFGPHRRS